MSTNFEECRMTLGQKVYVIVLAVLVQVALVLVINALSGR
jgi:hypothetical protein